MSRRGRAGTLPKWWRGAKKLDFYSGEEIYEYADNYRIQEGKPLEKRNFDSLTEIQRQESIQNIMR